MAVEVSQNLTQVTISSVGFSGANGTSGTSGVSGTSGTSAEGTNGSSGTSGVSIDSSSLATTGSNTFNGNQIISGSIYMGTGSIILSNGTEISDMGEYGVSSGISLGNNGFNIDFGSNANDWAIFQNAGLIKMLPSEQFSISLEGNETGWNFNGNGLYFPDDTLQTTAYPGPIDTGSFATTGSNQFDGNQSVTGSVYLDGNNGIYFGGTDGGYISNFAEGSILINDPYGYIQIDANGPTEYSQIILNANNYEFFNVSDLNSDAAIQFTKSGSLLLNGVSYDAHLATTGSNTFVGDQTISGSLAIVPQTEEDNVDFGGATLLNVGNVESQNSVTVGNHQWDINQGISSTVNANNSLGIDLTINSAYDSNTDTNGNVIISTNDYNWNFTSGGLFQLPGDGVTIDTSGMADSGQLNIVLPGLNSGESQVFRFSDEGGRGELVFPDGTRQSTAYQESFTIFEIDGTTTSTTGIEGADSILIRPATGYVDSDAQNLGFTGRNVIGRRTLVMNTSTLCTIDFDFGNMLSTLTIAPSTLAEVIYIGGNEWITISTTNV